jgi:hypothetical protein
MKPSPCPSIPPCDQLSGPAFAGEPAPGAPATALPRHWHGRLPQWYLLPDEERRRMLAEHGMAAPRLQRMCELPSEFDLRSGLNGVSIEHSLAGMWRCPGSALCVDCRVLAGPVAVR